MPPQIIDLPYGSRPLRVTLPGDVHLLEPPHAPVPRPLQQVLHEALATPIGAPPLENVAAGARRITLVVSDASRDEPRAQMVAAVLDRLPAARITLAVANGTHRPGPIAALGLDPVLPRIDTVVNHDGTDDSALVDLGTTAYGTPVRVNRCAIEADLVVATGRIRPHYFAGYGAGAKAIFPGLAATASIRHNHRLKSAPGTLTGAIVGNPCRDDIEEAAGRVPTPSYLLDVVLDADGGPQLAVAGHLRDAFAAGAERARALFAVRAPRSACIVVSDELPVTASLYQSGKLIAAVAPVLLPGGTIIMASECADGTGPLDAVNRGIYELGLVPRLPAEHQIVLVSSLPESTVSLTYCRSASSVEDAVSAVGTASYVVVPRASPLIVDAIP